MYQSRLVFMRTPCVASFLLLLSACAQESTNPSEIKPGNPAYPAENPHPTHFVEFTAAIPATLSVRFVAMYHASAGAGAACQQTVGLAVYAPYSISVPVQLQGGATPRGVVAVGINYFVPNAWPHLGALVGYETRTPRPDERSAMRVNVWCAKDRQAPDPRLPERCMSWWMLNGAGWISPAAGGNVPVDDQNPEPPVTIFSEASNIEIRFHDADLVSVSGRAVAE